MRVAIRTADILGVFEKAGGSKSFTSPAMRQSNSAGSNAVMVPTPLFPALRLLQNVSRSFPTG